MMRHAVEKHTEDLGAESKMNCTWNKVTRRTYFNKVAFEQIWTEIWMK